MAFEKKLTLSEIMNILEECDDILDPTVFIEPPENATISDGDSDDEDTTGDVNRLSGNQLRASAELFGRKISENVVNEVRYGNQDDIEEPRPSQVINEKPEEKKKSSENSKCNNTEPNKKPSEHDVRKRKQQLETNQISKRKNVPMEKRTWEAKDILDQSSIEFSRAPFLSNEYSPVELFQLFFDDEVTEYIVNCSIKYSREKGNMIFTTSKEEMRLFFAILFLSGYNVLPRTRMYWEIAEDVHNETVSKAMSRNRFEDMMRNLHFCDNSNLDKNDKFAKIRPVMCMLNQRWMKFFPGDVYLSIDESMVPYFGRHGAKQHIHGKPIRFGYKVWILATRLGYAVQANPYQGKCIQEDQNKLELGVGGSVVIDFVSALSQDIKYSIFFDNFFTSFRLLEKLKEYNCKGTGTVRKDRVEKAPLKDPKELKKEGRGSYHQLTDKESDITLIRYNDNNVFTIASTASGVHPMGKAKRWSSAAKKHIYIDQPSCIAMYNMNMGGVDRMDENVANYRINIRNKKWYWPMIGYLLNVSMNNAWLLYRMTPKGDAEKLDFLGFIRYVTRTYFATCSTPRTSPGRPSMAAASRVLPDIRFDGISHHLVTVEKQLRCGLCKKATRKKCKKCNVGCHVLCAENFHSRQ